jgi:hypothetical protein
MLPRERVFAALDFSTPDVVPLEYHPSPAGLYEHGDKLRELWREFPGDFGDAEEFPPAAPPLEAIDSDGKYSETRRDEWGVVWKYLIFGVAGHPVERPLDDWASLEGYASPKSPLLDGAGFRIAQERATAHMRRHFLKSGWISLFEVMHALRRFEDILMDIAGSTAEANRLADLITEYQLEQIRYMLARGVDAIQFGDDFGTQAAMILSPATFRRFFKPRFARLMDPIHAAGKQVFFHTCGRSPRILNDLRELGVHAVWPQLNAYDEKELARVCREARMAVAIHPDRGELMVHGTPRQVRDAVSRLAGNFRVGDGGAWFYVEIDAGFPFENVRALVEAIAVMRGV